MRILLLLLASLFLVVPVSAQTTSSPPAEASPDAAVEDLVRILEDDTARAELIARLKAASEASPETPAEVAAPNFARQLAEYTRAVAEGASSTIRAIGTGLGNVRAAFSGAVAIDQAELQAVAVGLVILLVGLFGGFAVLRLVVNALIARTARRVAGRGLAMRLGGLVVAHAIDAASIVLAWGLGYVLALSTGLTPAGQMGINQSLLLNAFLIVEISKLGLRIVLVPRFPQLRLLPVTDDNAAYWSFWLGRIVSLIGYGVLFFAPLLTGLVSPAAGAVVQMLVVTTAVVIGVIVVLQNRDDVRHWLEAISASRGDDNAGRLLVALGHQWHVVAILYLVALLVVWFANPEEALPFMIGATVQTVIAIGVGALIVSFISRFVSGGLKVPPDVRERLPLLETRLHAFVPRVMLVVRWVVVAGVVVAIGQAWELFDFVGWLGTEEGLQASGAVVSAVLIVLVAIVLHVVVASWVEFRLNPNFGTVPTAREKTLLNLFKNAFTIALVLFGSMLALGQIGVNIAPLLAGAGVVGLAIGFGAQKLVQDIITGIFIQFENVMNEGDVVAVGDKSGVVEKLTIRSVTIRDVTGTVHLIPFSSVDQVSNMMRGFSFHVADIGVAYESDIEQVKAAMQEAFELLMQTEHGEAILDDLDMQGVTAFADSSITIRARIKTLPGKQWAAGRRYSEILKGVFDKYGIEIPYPHVTYVPAPGGRAPGGPAAPSMPAES